MVAPTWDALVLASAAVSAAGLAAWTAERRMGRQLDAESKRLDRQLRENADRAKEQLQHDRELRDRGDLRRTLDEGAELIGKAWTHLRSLSNDAMDRSDKKSPPHAEAMKAAAEAARQSVSIAEELALYWQRLMLRFAQGDPIAQHWSDLMSGFSVAAKIASPNPMAILSADQKQDLESQLEEFYGGQAGFLLECRLRFGVVAAAG